MFILHGIDKWGNEEIVFGMRGTNYRLLSYCKGSWSHKRFSKISSVRWISRGSVSISICRLPLSKTYKPYLIKVEEETILKILYHYRTYLEECGLRNFNRVGDVVLSEGSNRK